MEYRVSPKGNIFTFPELMHQLTGEHLINRVPPDIIIPMWESWNIIELESEEERKILQEKYKFIYEDPAKSLLELINDSQDLMVFGVTAKLKDL